MKTRTKWGVAKGTRCFVRGTPAKMSWTYDREEAQSWCTPGNGYLVVDAVAWLKERNNQATPLQVKAAMSSRKGMEAILPWERLVLDPRWTEDERRIVRKERKDCRCILCGRPTHGEDLQGRSVHTRTPCPTVAP